MLIESELLPLAVRRRMEYDYAVFAWENYNKTIARMATFGAECMKRWFPNGLPARPTPEQFGLPHES